MLFFVFWKRIGRLSTFDMTMYKTQMECRYSRNTQIGNVDKNVIDTCKWYLK